MSKVFFFCDSQMNILTTYFISKLYYEPYGYQMYLYISNNSANSVACIERAKQINLWSQVEIIEEFGQGESSLKKIGEKIKFASDDILHLYALQNSFARLLYKKAVEVRANIRITDEGIIIFNDFINWQSKAISSEMFSDIDIFNIDLEGWSYCPELYQLPSNVRKKKIQLSNALADQQRCSIMQKDVKTLFGIQNEEMPDVVYFDTYYTLHGRTTPIVEKFLLKKLELICGEFNFAIKSHPMERGFHSKYSEINASVLKTSSCPWEAYYFVNNYGKGKKFVCITGESSSTFNALLMFGDTNYSVILLKKIYDNYMISPEWCMKDFYNNFMESAYGKLCKVYMPANYDEFQMILSDLMEINLNLDNRLIDIDRSMLQQLCINERINSNPLCVCEFQIYRAEELQERIYQEHIIDDDKFYFDFQIPCKYKDEKISIKMVTPIDTFVAFKDVACSVFIDEKKEKCDMSHFLSEHTISRKECGFLEIQQPNVVVALVKEMSGIERFIFEGLWELDRNSGRLLNHTVNKCNEQIKDLENQLINLNQDMESMHKEQVSLYKNMNEINRAYTEAEECIRKKEEYICKLEDSIEKIKKDNEQLNQMLNAMKETISWKITKPFRCLRNIINGNQ